MEDVVNCLRCEVPLECPAWRQVDTPTVYLEFAVCNDCREHYLNEKELGLFFELSGENLKKLLTSKDGTLAYSEGK